MVRMVCLLKTGVFLCNAGSWSSSKAAEAGVWTKEERFSALGERAALEKKRVKAGSTVLQVVKLFYLATLIFKELRCELACLVIWTCNRVCFYWHFWRKRRKEEFSITLFWAVVNSLYSGAYLLDLFLLFVLGATFWSWLKVSAFIYKWEMK